MVVVIFRKSKSVDEAQTGLYEVITLKCKNSITAYYFD